MKKLIYKYSMITLGCAIIAIAINCFYLQQHFLNGGISGIAMILYYLLGWPIGTVSFILNVPLFFVAYRYLSKTFLIDTIFGTAMFSLILDLTAFLAQNTYVKDPLLSCIAGGVLFGVGSAMMYKVDGSSGGTDIIGFVIYKYYSISVSTSEFIINAVIMVFCAFLFGLEPVLYSMIIFYLSFRLTNVLMDGFDYKKNFIIITNKPDELAQSIMTEVGRGVTFLHGEGAYTHQTRKLLFVVVKLTQVNKIKNIVKELDRDAFMIIHDTADVLGHGFTLPDKVIDAEEVKKKQMFFYSD